ncbi:MAG: rhodanese-like domain-containing protein [Chitinophagaceae bacterium]|nr:rhodanese-like domain-containing protein [Chitinophagaceae bacterium]
MKTITAEEFQNKCTQNDILAIDVREEWEYAEYNIGNRNIPLYSLPDQIHTLELYKNKTIILYCKSGNRSKLAMKYIEENGFTNVADVKGGITAIRELLESEK